MGEISDYSGSVSAAELSDMVGLTEEEDEGEDEDEEQEEDDRDDLMNQDGAYLSSSEKDHDGDVEEEQEDQDNKERIDRRNRIRKNSKLGNVGRRSISGVESLSSVQSLQDESLIQDSNFDSLDQVSRLESSNERINTWSWFSSNNLKKGKGKGKALDSSSSFLQVSNPEENPVIYTSGSSDGENNVELDLGFEESLASNPQAQSAGLGSRSVSTKSFKEDRFNGQMRSRSDLGSSLSLGQNYNRVPKRRHRRNVLDGERSSKRSNTSQSGMSKDGIGNRLDIGLINSEKERVESRRGKDVDANATSRKGKTQDHHHHHQASSNGETYALSRRSRLIGSLLKKIFDLEPEILDSFLQGGGAGFHQQQIDHQPLSNVSNNRRNERGRIEFGLPGDLDSNSRYEYDYGDLRTRRTATMKNQKTSRIRLLVDGREVAESSGEETAMEEGSKSNHQQHDHVQEGLVNNQLSTILQLSRARNGTPQDGSVENRWSNSTEQDEEFLTHQQELSDSIHFSRTVKSLQLQSRQLSNPNLSASTSDNNRTTYAYDSTSSTAFEPSALEALNDVLSNVPLRFLGQLARRIGFGWSIWSTGSTTATHHSSNTRLRPSDNSPAYFDQVDENHQDTSRKGLKTRRNQRVGSGRNGRVGMKSSSSASA